MLHCSEWRIRQLKIGCIDAFVGVVYVGLACSIAMQYSLCSANGQRKFDVMGTRTVCLCFQLREAADCGIMRLKGSLGEVA